MELTKTHKIVIGVVVGLLVVGIIAGIVAKVMKDKNEKHKKNPAVAGSKSKAVDAICSSTDFKGTCQESLSGVNSNDPKELIKAVFNSGVRNLGQVIKNTTLIKEAEKDETVQEALKVCNEVLNLAVGDFNKSAEKITDFESSKAEEYAGYLQMWLSAVVTYQDTCIEAFGEAAAGSSGEKMKKTLQYVRELTLNGLSMVSEFSKLLSGLDLGKLNQAVSQKRLLSLEEEPEFGRRLLNAAAGAANGQLTPNAVVAQDGSGQYNTISAAVAAAPPKGKEPFVIRVKAGVYKENVNIKANKVMLIGDGPDKTKVSGSLSSVPGLSTYHTATVAVNGQEFFAKDLTIENTAGPEKHQAVALRISGEYSVLYNVHLHGHQDTLYSQTYHQYYRDCTITGTIDYVFGNARALYQNCHFITRKPMANQACMVTAQGRSETKLDGAFVFQNCSFTADNDVLNAQPPVKVFLGRPWQPYSRTIIMNSQIEGFIQPDGWSPWDANMATDKLYYVEYENRGAGASKEKRVNWKGYVRQVTPQTAEEWIGTKLFQEGDSFIRNSGVPYVPTMMKS